MNLSLMVHWLVVTAAMKGKRHAQHPLHLHRLQKVPLSRERNPERVATWPPQRRRSRRTGEDL